MKYEEYEIQCYAEKSVTQTGFQTQTRNAPARAQPGLYYPLAREEVSRRVSS